MRYGYFDDDNREYVIERPDTPRPWSNYSGNMEYNTIVTTNAGGYSYFRNAAYGRILRQHFNGTPIDTPGRYLYLRDRASGDYWSNAWQPVAKPLESFKTKTRIGIQYTTIQSSYNGINTDSTYFVPTDQCFEYWLFKVENTTNKPVSLDCFTYCEFANQWKILDDFFDLQYSHFINRADYKDGFIHSRYHENVAPKNDSPAGAVPSSTWMCLEGAEVSGWECNREKFLGYHRGYHNPVTVETGTTQNGKVYGNNACGTMQFAVELAPGEAKEFVVLLGPGYPQKEGVQIREKFGSVAVAKEELEKIKTYWDKQLSAMQVQTPSADFNHMVNIWNPYCAMMNFIMNRSASLLYTGIYTGYERNGLGFRDAVQDTLGVTHMKTELVRKRLELILSGQEASGAGRPQIHPFTHNPGSMPATALNEIRSDDCMWLFIAVPNYVNESGDLSFYSQVIPYSDTGEATVLGHLKQAIVFSLNHLGAHGLPCGLKADWNDSVVLGQKGESTFVAMQLFLACKVYAEICTNLKEKQEAQWAETKAEELKKVINDSAWDGAWYVRGFRENGEVIGSKTSLEGQVWLNPNLWSVISGVADEQRAQSVMETIARECASDVGLSITNTAFVKTDTEDFKGSVFLPGIKENGGIYNHNQGWGVIAEIMLGRGDTAWKYYTAAMPSSYNDKIEMRLSEPYVHCQSTASVHAENTGEANVAWLSGTASWMAYSATHYILGIRPQATGLQIDPCIPSDWDQFTAKRTVRGKKISIEVQNPNGVCKGISHCTVNGKKVEGGFIGEELLTDGCTITAVMG